MNLYKISQTVNSNYDTYDSAVVAAPDQESARLVHPSRHRNEAARHSPVWDGSEDAGYSDWCAASDVKVEYVGLAAPGSARGVVVSSFNAG